jgi:hypothetical protein
MQQHQRAFSLPLQIHYIRAYFTYSSRGSALVAVADGARVAGKDYVEAVQSSAKVAGHGVALAADAIGLCEYLSKGYDADIRSFIDGMGTIVRQAQTEADATRKKFVDVSKRLLQVCCRLQSTLELLIEAPVSS